MLAKRGINGRNDVPYSPVYLLDLESERSGMVLGSIRHIVSVR